MRRNHYRYGICCGVLFALTISQLCVGEEKSSRSKAIQNANVDAADYESLQAAIDALPDAGGIVRLPPRTFEISQPVVLRAGDVQIQGSGPRSHIKNVNTDGKPALLISSERPHPKQNDRLESLWRVQLSGFRITGNEQSGHGIEAHFVNELYVDGLTISDHGRDGIHMHFCIEDARVNDVLITYNKGTGIHANGNHDTIVSASHFEENNDAVRFIDGFNLTATGNNIDDHLRHGIVVENSKGSTISGNMIEQCAGVGIILDRDTYGTTVGSNIFAHNKNGGVELLDAHGITVTGNTFSCVTQRAVAIDSKCHAITISGNTFNDRSVGEGEIKGPEEDNVASGIVLDGASQVNLSGNTFSNIREKALELTGNPSHHIVFANNLLIDSESDHNQLVDSVVANNLVAKETAVRKD